MIHFTLNDPDFGAEIRSKKMVGEKIRETRKDPFAGGYTKKEFGET
jgi:hypothetical protein